MNIICSFLMFTIIMFNKTNFLSRLPNKYRVVATYMSMFLQYP